MNINDMTNKDFDSVVNTLTLWAESHPRANYPVIGFAGNKPLTPIQLVTEVKEKTLNGKSFIRMLQLGTEVMSLEEILRGFNRWKLNSITVIRPEKDHIETRQLCLKCKKHFNWNKYVKIGINICYKCRNKIFPRHMPTNQYEKYLIIYCKKYKYDHS